MRCVTEEFLFIKINFINDCNSVHRRTMNLWLNIFRESKKGETEKYHTSR